MSKTYAKGTHAVAECQRSGQKMRYKDLVEDGHVPGLLVHPDWWEPKHPQEIPVTVTDPIALERPAPEISIETGYGNVEQPLPVPASPVSAPRGTLATALSGNETHIVPNEAVVYTIGDWLFIELDGGGAWHVSRIAMDSTTPTFKIPFMTAFVGAAGIGNNYYIEDGS
jgi:hypothetical protein